jgi:hypothetical protein
MIYVKYGWVTNLFIMEILWFNEFYYKKAVFSGENVPKFSRNLNSGNHNSPGKWAQVPQEIMVSQAKLWLWNIFFQLFNVKCCIIWMKIYMMNESWRQLKYDLIL